MAKALAERYRSIIPEEKERLELLAKADKERFGFHILWQYAIIDWLVFSQFFNIALMARHTLRIRLKSCSLFGTHEVTSLDIWIPFI